MIAKLILGAVLFASPAAFAATGIAPNPANGLTMPDATWLNGLAGGQNESYQYGITATGSTQAGATQLPAGVALIEVDTTASGTGVALPFCLQGMEFSVYNNGANTLTIYPNVVNNPQTGAQDTINNATSVTVATHTPEFFGCAKNGVWSAK